MSRQVSVKKQRRRRVGGRRIRKEIAAIVREERLQRQRRQQIEEQALTSVQAQVADYIRFSALVMEATLLAAGLHQRHREWRLRRNERS